MNTTDLLRELTGPLPTFGNRYSTALAGVHEVEHRIELARVFSDLDEERFGAVIADLEAQLHDWKSALAAATRDRKAADACSVRMRGSTVSVRPRGARLHRDLCHTPSRPVRTRARGAGRPRAQSTRSSARSGDSGDDGLGESDDPEEPPTRRLCAFCNGDLSAWEAQVLFG